MSNLISILHKAKWVPRTYNVWQDDNGATWVMTGRCVSPDTVAHAIIKSYALIDLQRADAHYCGKGMSEGVHFSATLALMRNFKPAQFSDKCLLETLISAACWSAERIHSINPEYSNVCPRCGNAVETPLHCYWECPANQNIDEPAVQKTQHLIPAAVARATEEPCLWLRGILPVKYIPNSCEDCPNEYTVTWVDEDNDISQAKSITSGIYYGDASGGENTSYPEIRRVGCAFVKINDEGDLVYGAHFPLPGPIQTVPRGELFVVLELVKHAFDGTDITYYTDNEWVFKTFNRGPKYACQCNNADLFYTLFKSTCDKAIRLVIKWMPSHLEEGKKVWPPDVSVIDVKGNQHADTLAGTAADRAKVPLQTKTNVVYYYNLVKNIQLRIITIIKNLPERKRKETVLSEKELKPTIDEIVENSKHTLVHENGRYNCTVCNSSFKSTDKLFKEWVGSPCTDFHMPPAFNYSHSKPAPINCKFMHVGNQFIHHSHRIHTYKGFVYCGKCGYKKGDNQVRMLAKPCGPPGSSGLRNLEAIRLGRLPPGMLEWPDEGSDESSDEALTLY